MGLLNVGLVLWLHSLTRSPKYVDTLHTHTCFIKRILSYCMNNVTYFRAYCGHKGKYLHTFISSWSAGSFDLPCFWLGAVHSLQLVWWDPIPRRAPHRCPRSVDGRPSKVHALQLPAPGLQGSPASASRVGGTTPRLAFYSLLILIVFIYEIKIETVFWSRCHHRSLWTTHLVKVKICWSRQCVCPSN